MPGHKRQKFDLDLPLSSIDITEIEGFDNLHDANGIIKEAQDLCAKTFGAEKTFFLVNGSTCGIEAAILSSTSDKSKLLLARNCHKSVYGGMILSGAKPIYIYPELIKEYGIYGGISPIEIEKALIENSDISAVIITSPTYEGVVSDIYEIAKTVHKYNKILIVDEAHGPHMKFHKGFPKTALQMGADIVIQSLHKTLPSLTQTAVMHIQGERVKSDKIKKMLGILESSSPSYVFLASIDKCRNYLDENGKKDFEKYYEELLNTRRKIEQLKNIKIIGKNLVGKDSVFDYDIGKLVFFVNKENFNGYDLKDILLKKYNMEMEMCGINYCIAMTSVSDNYDYFKKLYIALKEIDENLENVNNVIFKSDIFSYKKNKFFTTPREAIFADSQYTDLYESIGKVSADFLIPYPPGIPLLVPGEIVTEEIINALKSYRKNGIEVIGCEKLDFNLIKTLKNDVI